MNEKQCHRCGTLLLPAALDDLCPQCLLSTAASALAGPGDSIHYFGDYELIQEIARGGMGIVYAARQKSLNRIVALKKILHGTLANAEQVRRFRAEAEAAARLHHPGIVGIYEIGEHEGQQYFSMEYIEGSNLAEVVREGPVPARRAAELLKTISVAVAYAHQHGVLHRDLKPSNVLVDEHDQPHVTDFGLAKLLTGDTDLTLSGQMLGTPSYMSTEQAAGDRAALGPATDIYSLGALLYHLLTGRPPFVAATVAETLRLARETEPAALRSLEASVPPDLETICLKCLAKEPQRRYATAQELAADLERFLRGEPIHARPVTRFERAWRWCRREPALAGAIGVVALALVVVPVVTNVAARRVQSARGQETQERQRAERLANDEQTRKQRAEQHALAAAARERQRAGAVAQTIGMERAAASFAKGPNSDGVATLAALLRASPTNRLVTERLLSALSALEWPLLERRAATATGHVTEAVFSPDGTMLATGTDLGTVRTWNAATGEPLTPALSLTGNVKRIRFGDQGRYFAACTENSVRAWNTTSGVPLTPVLPCLLGKDGFSVSAQDGLFTTCNSNVVSVFDVGTGTVRHRLEHDGKVSLVVFGPAGTIAIFQYTKVLLWHAGSGRRALRPLRLNGSTRAAVFSADGQYLAMALTAALEVIATTNGVRVAQMPLQGEPVVYLSSSPRAPHILAVSDNGPARLWNATDGRLLGGPMAHDDWVWVARFSGNGERIITWGKDRTARVWSADATGRLMEPILCETKIANAEISPDGQRVAVVSSVDEAFSLWRLPARAPLASVLSPASPGSNLTQVQFAGETNALLLTLGGGLRWTTSFPSWSRPHTREGDARAAHFTPDGARVIAALGSEIWIWDAASGEAITNWTAHAGGIRDLQLSLDGRFTVTASENSAARIWNLPTGAGLAELPQNGPAITASFNADVSRVLTQTENGELGVWALSPAARLERTIPASSNAPFARWAGDGRRVLSALAPNTAMIWDADTGASLTAPMVHQGAIRSAEFSADGELVVTASADHTARLWDARSGQLVGHPFRHAGAVNSAVLSRDGTRLITASDDGTARLWDVLTGWPVSEPLRHAPGIRYATFSPDQRHVVLAGRDGYTRVVAVPVALHPAPAWLPDLAEVVAQKKEGDQYTFQRVPPENIFELQQRIAQAGGDDFYARWARWFFARPGTTNAFPVTR